MHQNTERKDQSSMVTFPDDSYEEQVAEKRPVDDGITEVKLEEFRFSPPGPMGWTNKEYERMIEEFQK